MRVSNPTDSDITVDEGCVVAVALFYSSVICPAILSVEDDEKDNENDSVDMFAAPTQNVMHSEIPEMPLRSTPYIHRSRDQTVFCYGACVARSVDRKERVANPKAKAALDKEWNKLITAYHSGMLGLQHCPGMVGRIGRSPQDWGCCPCRSYP